jgi:cytochrome c oxidase cbb3-type subunit 3
MSSNGRSNPRVTGHVYDGIEEYDNPTPGWWSWIFAASIAFSAVYFLFVILADGQLSPLGFYDRELTADAERQFAQLGEIKSDPASILTMSTDDKLLRVGGAIFQGNCAACHGLDGAGLTGPNLTDNYYLHVQKIGDFVDVISKGRNNGAMPAWENRLEPRQVALLATYVTSLRGKNRPGREPQGTVIPAWSVEK